MIVSVRIAMKLDTMPRAETTSGRSSQNREAIPAKHSAKMYPNLGSGRDLMAGGERVKALPATLQTWCLPRATIVTRDPRLQARYEQRRNIMNDIVLRDMLRLRELLQAYRELLYAEPHHLLRLDQKIRYMDDMVSAFITKWTFKTHRWSVDATSDFPKEFGKLISEIINFVASARSVMRYAYSLNTILQLLVQN